MGLAFGVVRPYDTRQNVTISRLMMASDDSDEYIRLQAALNTASGPPAFFMKLS